MVKIKEDNVGFNYGLLATVDGVCHAGIYPISDEGGDWCIKAEGGYAVQTLEQGKMKLEDINLKLLEMELKMCPDLTPEQKFEIYLNRRACVTFVEMLQYVGLYISDL